MKIIIAGSRDITDEEMVFELIENSPFRQKITEVVCGLAKGVDLIGKKWAEQNGIPVKEFPADWKGEGKKAGHLRNEQMAKYADGALIIWDGRSKGTEDMANRARRKGIPTDLICLDQPRLI